MKHRQQWHKITKPCTAMTTAKRIQRRLPPQQQQQQQQDEEKADTMKPGLTDSNIN